MKIAFVTMEKTDNRLPNSVGSSRIRARWVYERWDEAEEYRIGGKYDVLIFQKVYWENMMEQFQGIKILDLCDPDWLEGRDVMKYCNLCDAVTTSTEALAEYIRKFVKVPVTCIPDRVALEEHKPIKKDHKRTVKSAVWYGYSHNAHYLDNTLYHLARYNIGLTAITDRGWNPSNAPVTIVNKGYNYPGIHEELIKHDIVLLPDTKEKDLKGKKVVRLLERIDSEALERRA